MSTFLIFKLVGSLWQCSSKKQRSLSIFQTEETEYRDWLYISGNVEKQNETLSTDHLQIRSYRKTSCCMQTFSFFDISIVHISKIFFRWFRQVLYFLTLHFYKCFPSDLKENDFLAVYRILRSHSDLEHYKWQWVWKCSHYFRDKILGKCNCFAELCSWTQLLSVFHWKNEGHGPFSIHSEKRRSTEKAELETGSYPHRAEYSGKPKESQMLTTKKKNEIATHLHTDL